VTSLDKGKPVPGADITVNNCRGVKLWSGKTNDQGLARIDEELAVEHSNCLVSDGLFITARKALSDGAYKGRTDLAFVFTEWQKGIESWRFNQPTASPGYGGEFDNLRAHTVLDRTLFRAGETVSMKHLIRKETISGLGAWPAELLPDKVRITHTGSGTEYSLPVHWDAGRQALSSWTLPSEAKLGAYDVELEGPTGHGGRRSYASGSFRVEEFRLPLVDARLSPPRVLRSPPRNWRCRRSCVIWPGGAWPRLRCRSRRWSVIVSLSLPGMTSSVFRPLVPCATRQPMTMARRLQQGALIRLWQTSCPP